MLARDAATIRRLAKVPGRFDGGAFAETRTIHWPLELPRVLLLPSAPVAGLPAIRSDFDEARQTFACHTRWDKVERGGQCRGVDVCARGKCAPFSAADLAPPSGAAAPFLLLLVFLVLLVLVLLRRREVWKLLGRLRVERVVRPL